MYIMFEENQNNVLNLLISLRQLYGKWSKDFSQNLSWPIQIVTEKNMSLEKSKATNIFEIPKKCCTIL